MNFLVAIFFPSCRCCFLVFVERRRHVKRHIGIHFVAVSTILSFRLPFRRNVEIDSFIKWCVCRFGCADFVVKCDIPSSCLCCYLLHFLDCFTSTCAPLDEVNTEQATNCKAEQMKSDLKMAEKSRKFNLKSRAVDELPKQYYRKCSFVSGHWDWDRQRERGSEHFGSPLLLFCPFLAFLPRNSIPDCHTPTQIIHKCSRWKKKTFFFNRVIWFRHEALKRAEWGIQMKIKTHDDDGDDSNNRVTKEKRRNAGIKTKIVVRINFRFETKKTKLFEIKIPLAI